MEISIKVGTLSVDALLNDTATARKVAEALPISSSFSTWGDEIYFSIPVESRLDGSAKEVVQKGDLGYWPTGKAFCIFFGPTPMSEGGKIVPASAVNIIGQIKGDAEIFKQVMREHHIVIEPKKW
ncbi:MAG: cyclophilin-like fold protein [Thermodesulfobacteriota bacterium]